MHAVDESALFVIHARLGMESDQLRKIADKPHLRDDETIQLQSYAKKLDMLRQDMKINFKSAF